MLIKQDLVVTVTLTCVIVSQLTMGRNTGSIQFNTHSLPHTLTDLATQIHTHSIPSSLLHKHYANFSYLL